MPNLNRAVLAGRPGEGKTLLARMSARKIAEAEYRRFADRECEPDELHLPVFVSLPLVQRIYEIQHGANPDASNSYLSGRVCQILQRHKHKPGLEMAVHISLEDFWEDAYKEHRTLQAIRDKVIRHIIDCLYTERCVLFLDALDECAEPEKLEKPLEILSKAETRCRVLVTGRPHAMQRDRLDKILGSRPAEYDLAPLAPLQRRGFIESWFGDDPDKSRVLGLLENHARFNDLTGNPQLLGLCCFAAADGDFDPKSLNRAALFKLITRHLLRTDWKRAANPNAPTLPEPQEDLLELVAATAFKLFEKNPAGNRFGYLTWHMEADAAKKRMGLDGTEWSANNITEILRYGGLLVKPGAEEYAFLHRGFFEFLTALYLSWRIADGCKAVNGFLDKKAWDPAYKEVFAFLIGLLDDPQPLFAMLSNPNKDDRFRHRLELASYCLPEVKPSFQASAVFPEFREGLAKEARDYLDTLLPEEIAGKWWPVGCNEGVFINALIWLLGSSSLGDFGLIKVEDAITTSEFLVIFARLLVDADTSKQNSAINVVINLGEELAKKEIFLVLALLMDDSDSQIRSKVRKVVMGLNDLWV